MTPENRISLRRELERDEDIRYVSYQDSLGLWTIGIGHLLGPVRRMTEITYSEVEALFAEDVKAAERLVRSLVPGFGQLPLIVGRGELGPSRERALVNMAFNLGGRLAGFKKFLKAVNARDWPTAAVEMMDSKWATQVGDRATRLRDQILTDD